MKAVENVTFNANREGFLFVLSRRESSSNLNLDDNVGFNIKAQILHNNKNDPTKGYIGYFQLGESALYDAGYFTVPYAFSSSNSSVFQKALKAQDWVGSWTGKDGVTSKKIFLTGRRHQLKAINILLNKHCLNLRNKNINEFYGKIISGVEITESGCVAGCHLKGAKYVLDFVLGLSNAADAFGTKVGSYISLLAHYDLETCCNRRVRIVVVKNGIAAEGIQVNVESEYREGKYFKEVGVIKNNYKTDKDGKIPVIIRHPGAKIKITIGAKTVEIMQEANKIQEYQIDITEGFSARSVLAASSTPEPKPVENKTPQELRTEAEVKKTENTKQSAVDKKDINFNIVIEEGDTKRPISNMRFYITYKGNIKEHRTDSNGVKSNIVATEEQDIEISVAKSGGYQAIHHFIARESMQGQTIKVNLQVHKFKLKVIDKQKKAIANTSFIIFYRGRQIKKKTDQNGVFKLSMLTGFVYGFALLDAKELIKCRCDKNIFEQMVILDENGVKLAKQFEQLSIAKPVTAKTSPVEVPKSKPPEKVATPIVKAQKPVIKQESTHTEKKGNPVTIIGNKQSTSDTTRYHIYHNGQIKRQNAKATGYAEFIYYDQNGGVHNLGKSAYKIATRWLKKGILGEGNIYLVDIQPFKEYRKGNVGYKMLMNSQQGRYYLAGVEIAAFLGAMCKTGYDDISFNGFSASDGSPGISKSHINGVAGDIRYLRTDKQTKPVILQDKVYDHRRTLTLINNFICFGWGKSKLMYSEFFINSSSGINKQYILPGCMEVKTPRHNNHLHLHGLRANLEDI